jgi:MoaA/NifB/PqqE/SkfB family radical SAM enzyme
MPAGWVKKLKLFSGLINGETARVGPFYVTVDITRQCNMQCPGCRFHSPVVGEQTAGKGTDAHMPFEMFSDLCDDLTGMGTESMTISGAGEPFLHPRLEDMVARAKAAGLTVSLFTNGTLLNAEKVNSLIDAGLDLLKVSLWTGSREEYGNYYPGTDPDKFDAVIEGLKLVRQIKEKCNSELPRVKLHQPIDRGNFRHVEALFAIARKTGCQVLSFSPFATQGGMFFDHVLTPGEEQEVRRRLTQLKKECQALPMDHVINTTLLRYRIGGAVCEKLPCYMGWLHARIHHDGNVTPCTSYELSAGNLREQSLPQIWNGPGFRKFRRATMTKQGLAKVAAKWDCFFCCHVTDNLRVHRLYRWAAPFFRNRR